ncbi:ORF52 [callitrichine gammaherpesvirus 3]|uniref:ORF52 n=1 Tax=callitrichine gammaherpesvirus 3 TaxID=106331 RepID=Q993F7_9GAMA|nr:ORF52 [callitrichine gammaherpesvirus 3]AAK38261.1 ORF52 [callitrichine gammaherpesvirus 3]
MISIRQHITLGVCNFALGVSASVPFVWCYVFANLRSLEMFSPWQTHIYRLGFTAATLFTLLWTLVPRRLASRMAMPVTVINLITGFAFFVMCVYTKDTTPAIPCLFMINLPLLGFWPRLACEAAYICPSVYQRYFELGALVGSVTYAFIIAIRALEVSSIFMAPYFVYIAIGYESLSKIKHSPIYEKGLERSRSIFCRYGEHAEISLKKMLSLCMWNVLVIVTITSICILFMVTLHLHTRIFFGIVRFIPLFMYGMVISGGIYLGRRWYVCVVMMMSFLCLSLVIFFCSGILGRSLTVVIFSMMTLSYFNAITVEVAEIRCKLHKFINAPLIHIRIMCLCSATLCFSEYVLTTFIKV